MELEKYSILMSVYKNEKVDFFIESVESMLAQTVPPDQFVIVKDGPLYSELEEAINSYAEKRSELFTIISLETNIGLGGALDVGLKECRNELVARMDSDDISFPDRCEKQLRCFQEDPDLSIVGGFINEFSHAPGDSMVIRAVPLEYEEIIRFARRRNPFNHPTVMYRKSSVIRCGGYGVTKRPEDLRLWLVMVNGGCKSKNLPEILLYYRADENNLLRRKSWSNCKECIRIYCENYKKGYSKLWDLIVRSTTEVCFFLMPVKFARFFSDKFLRRKK